MRIDLRENGPPVEVLLASEVGAALSASGLVVAAPSPLPGYWSVGPGNRVGVARVGRVELWITPKLSIERLFFLLGFARDGKGWREEDLPLAEAPDLLTAIADAFARQADRALQQGLLQGYRTAEESLPVLRGRLREADQMRRRFGMVLPVEVRYDDYTVDVAENQLLLAAAHRLLRLTGLPVRVRRSLQRTVLKLADVTLVAAGQSLPTWHPTRLNARYRVALRLAELVLRGGSVEQHHGTVAINGFMLDMPKVFEDFVSATLGASLAAYGGRVRAQDPWHLDEKRAIRMKPDLVWYGPYGSVRAVIDAKYKAEKPSGFPDADLYQMLAYCTALGLPRGHLVYAKGNEPATTHRVRNAGVEIVQHALDLDQTPQAVLEDIGRIATNVIARAGINPSTGGELLIASTRKLIAGEP